MTPDEIIKLAMRAGVAPMMTNKPAMYPSQEALETFAALIAAHEREECAKVCDNRITNEAGMQREDYENRQCAAAIRARGEAEYKKGEQRLTPPPVSYHDPFGIGARQQANDLARVGEVGLWGA